MSITKQRLVRNFTVLFLLIYNVQILAEIDPDYQPNEANVYARNDANNIERDPNIEVNIVRVTGNVNTNDTGAINSELLSPTISPYGSLAFSNDGSYVYSLMNNSSSIRSLGVNDTLTDIFTYRIESSRGTKTDTATLTINIFGASDNGYTLNPGETAPEAPVARDDAGYITRDKDTSISSLIITGTVSGNDVGATNSTLISSVISSYGILAFANDGTYTYALFNNIPPIVALGENQSLIDTFTYRVSNDIGQTDTANLRITILGTSDDAVVIDPNDSEPMVLHDDISYITRQPDASDVIDTYPDGNVAPLEVTITGSVTTNDSNFGNITLLGNKIGLHGSLALENTGNYTYTLFNRQEEILDLNYNEYLVDTFKYQSTHADGRVGEAKLTITIFGAEGIVSDNVEIESNYYSYLATPLHSAQNMKGHLQTAGDRDWFSIKSLGNEVIHLELCPTGSSCFAEKSWVMYVFDSAKLTLDMQMSMITLSSIGDDTGNSYYPYQVSHMYLQYRQGLYRDALIGVIDPCFGKTSTVDIGVGNGQKTYFVAISSPLQGSDDGKPIDECGVGNIILERPGSKGFYEGVDADGNTEIKEEETTEGYIVIFPRSEDQYLFEVSRTGVNPLKDDSFQPVILKDSHFNIPKLRIDDAMYSVNFNMQNTNNPNTVKLNLASYEKLEEAVTGEQVMAIYDSETNLVRVPKYLDEGSQKLYSLLFFYNPIIEMLELVEYSLIQ